MNSRPQWWLRYERSKTALTLTRTCLHSLRKRNRRKNARSRRRTRTVEKRLNESRKQKVNGQRRRKAQAPPMLFRQNSNWKQGKSRGRRLREVRHTSPLQKQQPPSSKSKTLGG